MTYHSCGQGFGITAVLETTCTAHYFASALVFFSIGRDRAIAHYLTMVSKVSPCGHRAGQLKRVEHKQHDLRVPNEKPKQVCNLQRRLVQGSRTLGGQKTHDMFQQARSWSSLRCTSAPHGRRRRTDVFASLSKRAGPIDQDLCIQLATAKLPSYAISIRAKWDIQALCDEYHL
jgi:hypothetical protein